MRSLPNSGRRTQSDPEVLQLVCEHVSGQYQSSKRIVNLRERNLCTFSFKLLAHQIASLVDDISVPGTGSRNTCGEHAGVIGGSDCEGAILKAKAIESEPVNRCDIANTGTRLSGNHVCLFFESQLAHKSLGPLNSIFPAPEACCIGWESVSEVLVWYDGGG